MPRNMLELAGQQNPTAGLETVSEIAPLVGYSQLTCPGKEDQPQGRHEVDEWVDSTPL